MVTVGLFSDTLCGAAMLAVGSTRRHRGDDGVGVVVDYKFQDSHGAVDR
jgi:hypothetical protein